jgi:hypothetical protein
MAHYESDITQFLRLLKEERPHLEEGQRHGRALLWEKDPIDLDEMNRVKESRVKQKPYVYQTS